MSFDVGERIREFRKQAGLNQDQLAAMIMMCAGLRRGEVLALTREDIDLIAGLIHVNKSIRFSGNRPLIVKPKKRAFCAVCGMQNGMQKG